MNPMAKPAQQRESLHIHAVHDCHPMFVGYGAVLTGRAGPTISA